MVMNKDEALETFGASLDIEREFDAPRERVWEAWTVPDLVTRWWGAKEYSIPVARISLRVGGQWNQSFDKLERVLAGLRDKT
jgi:uncharacterized protein YndB with AHSA1/START domain